MWLYAKNVSMCEECDAHITHIVNRASSWKRKKQLKSEQKKKFRLL
jgi:ribosomal protein L44E